jgi:hypothetical protein
MITRQTNSIKAENWLFPAGHQFQLAFYNGFVYLGGGIKSL